MPSSLRYTLVNPYAEAVFSNLKIGVNPSFKETIFLSSSTGRNSLYRHIFNGRFFKIDFFGALDKSYFASKGWLQQLAKV
jgi:hypothetical protein